MSTPKGSYIVYATKPGSVASDGTGRNGLFTSKLLQYLNAEGLNIEQVFKRVAGDVAKESNDAQRPWIASDYTGDFYFTPNRGSNTTIPTQVVSTSIYASLEDVWQQYLKDTKSVDFKECVKCNATTTEDYRIRARCYSELNDYEGAIRDLNKALGMDPAFVSGYSNRGFCYKKLGRYQEALADATKTVELSGGKYPWDYWGRAEIRYTLGDYQGSLDDADKAIQLGTGYHHSYILKWQALTGLGDKENARKALLDARDLNPEVEEVKKALRKEGLN